MLVLVVLLVVTNLVTVAALAWFVLRPPAQPQPDPLLARVLDGLPPPTVSATSTRRAISVEILNPIELAGTRGRWAGIAGSLAPGLTKRIVYDQTIRTMRRQLAEERVVADVRLHTLRPVPPSPAPGAQPGKTIEVTDETAEELARSTTEDGPAGDAAR